MDSPPDIPEWTTNRGLKIVGGLVVLAALYFAGSWAKERFVDSDRMLVGVHAIDSEEAIVMYRYFGTEEHLVYRIAKIQIDGDEPLWERNVGFRYASPAGNGISLAGERVVILTQLSAEQVELTAYELSTGQVAWQRTLPKEDGTATITGADRFVVVNGGTHLHVLDRATGKTIEQREGRTQNVKYAFTESWLEIQEATAVEYLEIESGRRHRIEGTVGSQCRIDARVYGFGRVRGSNTERSLLSRDLVTGDSVLLMPPEALIAGEPVGRFQPRTCGWRNNPDGSLRLLFSDGDGLLVAIDVDPSSPLHSGRPAWTHTFEGMETGEILYRVLNRLDLVWYGEVPRFAPLEVHLTGAPEEADEQVVVIDTEEGKLVRRGTPGDQVVNRLSSFKHGTTVFMTMDGRADDRTAALFAMDGQTGVIRAVTAKGDLRVEPHSVTDGAVWGWIHTAFSRESDLAVTVLDHELRVLGTRDSKRAPVANEDVITSLLGTGPGRQ